MSRTACMISAELNASWLVTANILRFMKRSSPSPPSKQMNCQTLGARAEAAGQRHSLGSRSSTRSHRRMQGLRPTSYPASAGRKKPKLKCCSVWQLLPHQPGELITKKTLEKTVIVRSLGSCILLTALKWIGTLLLLLKRGHPGAWMDSTYVLIWGTAKWDPSAGLKHGLLLKHISDERANRNFLVVFFFLFMALSWKMKTNFPYFSSLHYFDRLLSF